MPGYLESMDAALEKGPEEGQSGEDFISSLFFSMLLEHQDELRVPEIQMVKDVPARRVEAECIDDEDVLDNLEGVNKCQNI